MFAADVVESTGTNAYHLVISAVTVLVAAGAAFVGAWYAVRAGRFERREERQEEALAELRSLLGVVGYVSERLAHTAMDDLGIQMDMVQLEKAMSDLGKFWRRQWLSTIIDPDVQDVVKWLMNEFAVVEAAKRTRASSCRWPTRWTLHPVSLRCGFLNQRNGRRA